MAEIAELKALVAAGRDVTDQAMQELVTRAGRRSKPPLLVVQEWMRYDRWLADHLIQELVGRVEHAERLAQIRGQDIETLKATISVLERIAAQHGAEGVEFDAPRSLQ
jgi:hypothetical protein